MQQLMDQMAEYLNNPSSQIYKYNLLGFMETAIRSSNAQYHDPEFLNRLDIRLLESSPGEKGWETFMLDYKVDDLAPLQTIFSEDVMNGYIKIFNYLWKLKKVEHSLISSWRLNMAHNNKFS